MKGDNNRRPSMVGKPASFAGEGKEIEIRSGISDVDWCGRSIGKQGVHELSNEKPSSALGAPEENKWASRVLVSSR